MSIARDNVPAIVPTAEKGAREAIAIMKRMINDTDRKLARLRSIRSQFGTSALSTAITDLGFNPAELMTIYNAFKDAVETADDQATIPSL